VKNKVPVTIFEPNKQDVTGEWRKLHNKDLGNALSHVTNIISAIISKAA
jgi:hypothetical protein